MRLTNRKLVCMRMNFVLIMAKRQGFFGYSYKIASMYLIHLYLKRFTHLHTNNT